MKLVFRVDASSKIGSGHVYRTRNLAIELSKNGHEILFVTRSDEGNLINLLKKDFDVLVLPKNIENKNFNKENYLFNFDQINDAEKTFELITQSIFKDFNFLLIDHYFIDSIWHKHFKKLATKLSYNYKLIVIDDKANRRHLSDILIDQNYFLPTYKDRYRNLVPETCVQLLGTKYTIIPSVYKELHKVAQPRNSISRILIFFGGSDHNEYSYKVIKKLMNKKFSKYYVDIIMGIKNKNIELIRTLISDNKKIVLHTNLENLAFLITRADYSIGAGGSTNWERACLGLPGSVLSISEDQIPICKSLAKNNFINYFENIDSLLKNLEIILLEKDSSFIEQSTNLLKLVDGLGSSRISEILESIYDLKFTKQ